MRVQRGDEGVELRLRAQFGVERAVIDDVVAVSAARPRAQQRRGVEVADAEPRPVRHERRRRGEAEVAVLAACLKDIDLREPARWCLARMNCQGAADALVEAFKTATGTEYRVGLVNALGRKQGSNVLETLKIAAGDKEPEVALAAVEALANTPDAALDAVISSVESGSSSRRAARVARARVRLGSTLMRAGDDAGAKQVFTAVAGADVDEAPKKAAAAAVGG